MNEEIKYTFLNAEIAMFRSTLKFYVTLIGISQCVLKLFGPFALLPYFGMFILICWIFFF